VKPSENRFKLMKRKGRWCSVKLGADSGPSNRQRVIFLKQDPLRIEFYERDANTGARLEWGAPYKVDSLRSMTTTGAADLVRQANITTVTFPAIIW